MIANAPVKNATVCIAYVMIVEKHEAKLWK